jgi:hypothetical protein
MTWVIGIATILVGFAFVVLGASPLLSIALALIEGKPIPSFGGGAGLLVGGGVSIIAYGWHCVKGFKDK